MEISKEMIKELSELKDKMDVIEQQYKYLHSVDNRDWQTSVNVFHQDGKLYLFDRGKERVFGDKNEIEYFFKGISEKKFSFVRHFISNPIVELDRDKATFKSYYNATYIDETFTWIILGTYSDEMVKVNGKWKVLVKYINHGWNDFLIPVKDLKLKKEAIIEAKKRIFV